MMQKAETKSYICDQCGHIAVPDKLDAQVQIAHSAGDWRSNFEIRIFAMDGRPRRELRLQMAGRFVIPSVVRQALTLCYSRDRMGGALTLV
jgi:hypothetical protein